MVERLEELLGTEEVADYLGVGQVTVYRWCREGALPCIKIGRRWRIRRDALEEFVRKSERSETLTGQLRAFLEVPDNVMAIAQNRILMHRMDAAFFRVGEARGGTLVKYHREVEGMPSADELRAEFARNGLEVERLEGEGRFRLITERGEAGERMEEVERLVAGEESDGRSVWVNFDWEEGLDLEAALEQQRALTGLIDGTRLVVKTAVLEGALDEWPGRTQRRAQVMHAGTMWLSESGLTLSRVTPPPAL
ncbi:MAG: helix-turn-helix domain-containing protein [Rubrobacter sp.]